MSNEHPIRRNNVSFQPVISAARPGKGKKDKNVPRPAPLGSGSWPLGSHSWPLGAHSGPLGESGTIPLGSGSWPLGDGSWCLGGTRKEVGLGYHPDLPDIRDKDKKHLSEEVRLFINKSKKSALGSYLLRTKKGNLPYRINLGDKGKMPPVEDQGKLNSCTANAVIGLVEYLIKASNTDDLDFSRLFLYRTSRRLLGWTGDTGAYLRTTIKAMALFGVPPESEWPYLAELLDLDPDAYLYSYAQNFKAMIYARLDGYGMHGDDILQAVKQTIADGFPIAFGFPVYRSIENMGPDFVIPLPVENQIDKLIGGHAVLAVGYDDSIICANQEKPGALIVRNSWGTTWGDMGYGYLPFDYVRKEMALDFWTIFQQDWLNLEQFE